MLVPVNEYHEAKECYQRAKDRQRALHARVRKLKDRNAPAHAKLEYACLFCRFHFTHTLSRQLAAQHKEYEKARERKKSASRQKFQQMRTKWNENDKLVCLTIFIFISYLISGCLGTRRRGRHEQIRWSEAGREGAREEDQRHPSTE